MEINDIEVVLLKGLDIIVFLLGLLVLWDALGDFMVMVDYEEVVHGFGKYILEMFSVIYHRAL